MPRNPDQKFDFDELRQLAEFMLEYDLTEVSIEETEESRSVRLRRGGVAVAAPAPVAVESAGPAELPTASEAEDDSLETVTAPIIGTFYRSPRPGDPPFVDVGSTVKEGDVLCIIEAMKLMNHIEAEFDAEIVEILVENATPVEYGTPLFRVRRL